MPQSIPAPATRTKKGKLHLACRLKPQEIYEAGKSLAEALKTRAEAEVRLEAFKQQVKADITQAEGQAAKYQSLVASEIEFRMVDVEVRYNFPAGEKEVVRMDTGEIVRIERITDEERRLEIDTEKA